MAEAECSDPLHEEHRRRCVVLAATSAVVLASALYTHTPTSTQNAIGLLGYCLALGSTLMLGIGAWSLPVLLGLYARDALTLQHPKPIFAALRRLGPVVCLCTIVHLSAPEALPYGQPAGGIVGEVLGECLRALLGIWGVVVLGAAVLLWRLDLLKKTTEITQESNDHLELLPEPVPLLPTPAHGDNKGSALLASLADHGITGRVAAVLRGPLITTYEVVVDRGAKVSRIAALGDDLALLLGSAVRIVAPIPGKSRVGFELPNAERQPVFLRSMLANPQWKAQKGLTIALGVDPTGAPVYVDLSTMPHLLIAGGTGSGKSVGLHAMLASLLRRWSAEELRLILIDPKRVELSAYRDIPHLAAPVVTDMDQASRALGWVVDEMERRYVCIAAAGARDFDGYHARSSYPRIARLVVVVDELADLMLVAGQDIEAQIARLAQKARAAGIHLILATQRPSTDIMTGTIKANFPARIAYKVSQREDSKVILGSTGAESLLGQGDLLLRRPDTGNLARVHGAYVSEAEIESLCDQLRAQGSPTYEAEFADELPVAPATSSSVRPIADDGYERACATVRRAGYASASLLQREMSIGYNKAAKLVERMERAGLVSSADEANGGKRALLSS